MNWPTMSDYQEAIQNPANCFSDPTLKAGTAALNALGLPQPVTGGFCSVYQVTSGKTRWAVRCFLHNIKDLRERYAKISGFLRWHRVKQMVGFEYVPEGILVRGTWHPVLKMEWVDGETLNMYVGRHVDDPQALRKLAERWTEVIDGLEKAHIGHCDLQHGNVLVDKSGAIRLIDYDGMYVPPLRGHGSHEKGHPAYQHPQRDGKDFDEIVDRFPALVIQTSLLALAESPELWKRYYDDDNLIFRRADFQSPDGAGVFHDLEKLGGTVAEHAALLREACKRRIADTPRLRDVRVGKPKPAASAGGRPSPAPAPAPAPNANRNGSGNGKKARPAPPPPKPAPPPPKPAPVVAARASRSPVAAVAAVSASPAPRNPAPAPTAAAAPARPAARATAAAAAAAQPAPRAAVQRAPQPAPQPAAAPKPDLRLVRRGTGSASATPGSGWSVEWTRPGTMDETHIWQLPVHGTREAPRRILGITFGTRQEKFVESYQEKVEEHGPVVAGHRSAITSLAFTADARLLVSGARDGTLRVWSVRQGLEACAPLELRSGVVAMALAPDRPVVAAALRDRRLMLWDFGPRRQVIHLRAPDDSPLRAVAISGDGRLVAAGGGRRNIYVWHTDRGTAAGEVKGTTGRIESLAFTPDGSGLVCGTHKGRLELYDRGVGGSRWSVRTGVGRIVALCVPARSNGVLGGAAEGTVACWALADGSEQRRVRPILGRLTSLAVSADASQLLVGLASGRACLTAAGSGGELGVLDGHPGAVTASAIAGVEKLAATGTTDGTVRLWTLR
jgi:WD40 repeat protein